MSRLQSYIQLLADRELDPVLLKPLPTPTPTLSPKMTESICPWSYFGLSIYPQNPSASNWSLANRSRAAGTRKATLGNVPRTQPVEVLSQRTCEDLALRAEECWLGRVGAENNSACWTKGAMLGVQRPD